MAVLDGLRVDVVGGSIAGCATAIELTRLGCEVTVLERSPRALEGRGAGIGTPTSTFRTLAERGLVDADMPHLLVSDHPLAGWSTDGSPVGHTALTLPLDMAVINWGDLWQSLRARVPDSRYRSGCEVVAFEPRTRVNLLELAGGRRRECDLVVFADGYRSSGRRWLFPEVAPEYRGYVLWRGVLEEAHLDDSEPLERALYRFHYRALPGNAVFYLVPGRGGSTRPGSRWVNWACYVPVEPKDLSGFLTDRDGRRHTHSLPPGSMRAEEEQRLERWMEEQLPPYFSGIIGRSSNTFAQPIYTVDVAGYASGRACLLGDAGALAPPFTGSGVFKATQNATDLADALAGADDLEAALAEWGARQTRTGRRLAALGRQMESAFVWEAPDLGRMTEDEARAWWTQAISFPDEFTYVGEER